MPPKKQKIVCHDCFCRFPSHGANEETHRKMYHSPKRTVWFEGKRETLYRRDDGKIPCACGDESHARFNFQNIYTMTRKPEHPPPGNHMYPDIVFQRVAPTRPPLNPVDPTSNVTTATASTSTFINTAATGVPFIPLAPSSELLAPSVVFDAQQADPEEDVMSVDMDFSSTNPETFAEQPAPTRVDSPMANVQDLSSGNGDSMDVDLGPLSNETEQEEEEEEEEDDDDLERQTDGSESESEGEDVDEEINTEDFNDPPSNECPKDPRLFLLQYGIQVDPIYNLVVCIEPECQSIFNYDHIYNHKARKHYRHTNHILQTRLPPRAAIISAIRMLGGCEPSSPTAAQVPIHPISGVKIVDGKKCTVSGCEGHVYGSRNPLYAHQASRHPKVKSKSRFQVTVKCNPLNAIKQYCSYVEVIPPPSLEVLKSGEIDLFLRAAEACDLLTHNEVFNLASSDREKCIVFAQSHWDEMIQGVHIGNLMKTANASEHFSDPAFVLLREVVTEYYQEMVPKFTEIPVLTRRYLLTAKINGELKNQPFRRPQEFGRTVNRDADCITQFLCFLIIHQKTPMDSFPIPLHPDLKSHLLRLYEEVERNVLLRPTLKEMVHYAVWLLLSKPSAEFTRNDKLCPFTRFLIAAHLKDHGQFARAHVITPLITRAQWCFRASQAQQILLILDDFDGDSFEAFSSIRMFITEGKQVLFNSLRQSMHLLSSIAYRQQGIARFLWSRDRKTLSIDGFPVHIPSFMKNVRRTLADVSEKIKSLFRGCEYLDILEHIDQAMVPDESGQSKWFHDQIGNNTERYSFLEEDENDLGQFSNRLLVYLANNSRLFGRVDGKLIPNRTHVSDWFQELDGVVKGLFYLTVTTWGGSARGTEMENLLFANHPRNTRNVFFINGFLTITTEYSKNQSITGAGRIIARTPAYQVNRLIVLLVSVLYKTAGYIRCYIGSDKMNCQPYFYELFVCQGRSMKSADFTKVLGDYNRINAGVDLKLADFRQFMSCVLINATSCSFLTGEEEDENVWAAHKQFNHSVEVGRAHYGLDEVGKGTHIAPDAIAKMQQVSVRWQAFMGLLHNVLLSKIIPEPPDGNGQNSLATTETIKSQFRSLGDHITSQFEGLEIRNQHFLIQMFESFGTQITKLLHPFGQIPLYQNPRRLPVHPQVRQALQVVIRRKFEHFTSPEQAQLISSVQSPLHVLGILETGGCKSMSFFGATKLCPGRLFIVICPIARMEHLRLQLLGQGIIGGVWKENNVDADVAEILLVSAHSAGTDEFIDWVTCDPIRQRLMRIFIDKAHKILLDQSFHPCFNLFYRLTSTAVPITFLSATLMPRSIPYLLEQMQIRDPSMVDEIRHYTGRKNLKYLVEKIDDDTNILPTIASLVNDQGMHLEGKERGIIFCRTIDDVNALGKTLKSPVYHGGLDNEAQDTATEVWRKGKSFSDRWMLCTHDQAFCQDVDYPHVRYTVHQNPRELIDWVQETGRAGRDNLTAVCHTFWSALPCALPSSDLDHAGREEMRRLLPSVECLRLGFAALDRVTWSCTEIDGELCSNCEKAAQIPWS